MIKILKISKEIFRGFLFAFIALSIFFTGKVYGLFGSQKSIIEFFTNPISYEVGSVLYSMQIEEVNQIYGFIWLALACLSLYYILDYFDDKANHFYTVIRGWYKWATNTQASTSETKEEKINE